MLNQGGFGCTIGLALLSSTLAHAQTTHMDGPFVHAASGMILPTSVGEFKRFRETLDSEGASAGYGYASRQGRIAVSVFIVSLPSWQSDSEGCKKLVGTDGGVITKTHPDAQTLQPTEAPALDPTVAGIATKYTYSLSRNGPAVRSDHYYYCNVGGKWLVQYDFTYTANFDASSQISNFLHDLKWTIARAPL